MIARICAYAVGGAFLALGAWGIATNLDPWGWGVWFGGVVVAHDFVLAPLVLLAAAATTRWRRVQTFLAPGGVLVLISIPALLAVGAREDEPSRLPLPYGRNLLIVLAVLAVSVLLSRVVPLWRRYRKRPDA